MARDLLLGSYAGNTCQVIDHILYVLFFVFPCDPPLKVRVTNYFSIERSYFVLR
jgi:hypothetical protein